MHQRSCLLLAIPVAAMGVTVLSFLPTRATLAKTEAADAAIATAQLRPNNPHSNIDFAKHFQALEAEGAILIYNFSHQQTYQYNAEWNVTALSPASTFKIPNSLDCDRNRNDY